MNKIKNKTTNMYCSNICTIRPLERVEAQFQELTKDINTY